MSVECEIVLKVVKPVKALVYDNIRDYVGTIKNYDKNLDALRKNLDDLCAKKEYIINLVNEGMGNEEQITREADDWLKLVRTLAGDEKLRSLMYEDVETAKVMMRLMWKNDLKKLVRHDGEMQNLAVKVMNKLKEEMVKIEDADTLVDTVDYTIKDYKMVAEVVVEVMKDTTEEFKNLMKTDKTMAVIATRMLVDADLAKLTKGDIDMEDIFREAERVSYGNLREAGVEESSVLPVPGVDGNTLREAASKLLLPLGNLFPIVGELMNDSILKNALPKAEDVKFSWDVINGLVLKNRAFKKAMEENIRQHESCSCFCAFAFSYYRNQYKLSITAETIAERIKKDMIDTYSKINSATVKISPFDRKRTPTQFLEDLQSRNNLLLEILQILKDDQVRAVGVFGMGGCGKTTLAKEVDRKCVDMFSIMVEVSNCPDIKRIQGTIAESIRLNLDNVQTIAQRADMLHNMLISEKDKKFLIILDNIWEELDLNKVGIPRTCKLLLTTREKEVCRVMGVRDANTRELSSMNDIEAKSLFKSLVGDNGGREEYKTVTNRLLSKSGGLPLAIVVTANALKDKDLPYWLKFADDLEKPITSQLASGEHRATYSILATSYSFMESKEKRMFFLLCCLLSRDTHIHIRAVVRCGIGLDLFQHVNKLSEALDQADRWVDELMSSSMLLKSNYAGYSKIHDVVRAFGVSFAAKDDAQKLLVDGIPRWMNKKTLTEYTAISLFSSNDYPRLIGMDSNKLQILLLRSEEIPGSPISFFGRMMNLEVLDLVKMNFEPKLPESLGRLEKLRTLSLEGCNLGDIKVIGELVNLYVLSLRTSRLEELPNEIGKLINLRLLDLTDCTFKSRPNIDYILDELSELEGLFMCSNIYAFGDIWRFMSCTGYASRAIGFDNLHHLNALEMNIWCADQLSGDAQFLKNLDSFRICAGLRDEIVSGVPQVGYFRRILNVNKVDISECLGDITFRALVQKADWLEFYGIRNLSILFDKIDVRELPFLKTLNLRFLDNLVSLLGSENLSTIGDDVHEHQVFFNPKIVFSSLEEFSLLWCKRIVKLWDKDLGISSFQSLRTIRIFDCEGLLTVGPPSLFSTLVQLESLTINYCKSMHEVITTEGMEELEERDQEVIFPQLKDLEITSTNLKSFYGGKCKLKFPKLKTLRLSDLDYLNKFAGSEDQFVLFHREMDFPCLEELEVFSINDIIMGLWDWDLERGSTLLWDPVPMLTTMNLCKIRYWRQIPPIFCKNLSSLELKMSDDELLLSLDNEGAVCAYSDLPKLKDLRVCESQVLQDLGRSEDFEAPAAMKFFEQLINLELKYLPRLKIFPLRLFKSLCSLHLEGLSWEYVFSADTFVHIQESLQHLETLKISDCPNMRVVIQDDRERDVGLVLKFPRLNRLILEESSIISFSTTVNATLYVPFLEVLSIIRCDKIQHFWSGPIIARTLEDVHMNYCETIKSVLVGNPNHMVELPSLKNVVLYGCPAVLCFSSGPLTTPKIELAEYDKKRYDKNEHGMNLNNFFRSCHDTDNGEELDIFNEST